MKYQFSMHYNHALFLFRERKSWVDAVFSFRWKNCNLRKEKVRWYFHSFTSNILDRKGCKVFKLRKSAFLVNFGPMEQPESAKILLKIYKEKETIFLTDGVVWRSFFSRFRPIKYVVIPKRIIKQEQGFFGLDGAVRIKCCGAIQNAH